MNVLSAPDSRDAAAKPGGEDFLAGIDEGVGDLAIAVSPTLGYAQVDAQILEAFELVVRKIKAKSVKRVESLFADPAPLVGTFLSVGLARVYRDLGPAKVSDEQMDPAFVAAVRRGEQLPLQEYLDAVAALKRLIATAIRLFQQYDLLLTPTLPVAAFAVGMDDPPGTKLWKPFSGWVNLAKLPAASVPCGITKSGLPIGLQIVGPRFSEARVLRMARAVERACGFERPDLAERISVKEEL